MTTRKIKALIWVMSGLIGLGLLGCNPHKKISIGVYDWENQAVWTAERNRYMAESEMKKLYIKCLETDGHEFIYTQISGHLPTTIAIVPVIRLNSDYFLQCREPIAWQASRLLQEIVQFQQQYRLPTITEIQVDFDYTADNRALYFSLLKRLKLLSKDKITITLNLEKLKEKQALPPVDGAMLMLYDFGGDALGVPTIFNEGRLFSYQEDLKNYPLPLNFALATFRRTSLVRNHTVMATFPFDDGVLRDDAHFVFSGNNRYEVIETCDMQGIHLQKGDILVGDEATAETITRSMAFIQAATHQEKIEIAFFSISTRMMEEFTASQLLQSISGLK